ncbi:hypothetical protein GGI20_004611 [Coemansia sp. BCRC 34301]|nr:hypothetical protein GGI20_004611 [Coemansia sp. BCRC 34301]
MADLSSGIVAKLKVATCKAGLSKAFGLQIMTDIKFVGKDRNLLFHYMCFESNGEDNIMAFVHKDLAEMVVDGRISRYAILEVTDHTGVWMNSHSGSDVPALAITMAKFIKKLTRQIVDFSKHAVNEPSTAELTPYPISGLLPGCYDYTISAMVMSKSGVEKSKAKRFGKAFELGKSYLISNADVHWGNMELTKKENVQACLQRVYHRHCLF